MRLTRTLPDAPIQPQDHDGAQAWASSRTGVLVIDPAGTLLHASWRAGTLQSVTRQRDGRPLEPAMLIAAGVQQTLNRPMDADAMLNAVIDPTVAKRTGRNDLDAWRQATVNLVQATSSGRRLDAGQTAALGLPPMVTPDAATRVHDGGLVPTMNMDDPTRRVLLYQPGSGEGVTYQPGFTFKRRRIDRLTLNVLAETGNPATNYPQLGVTAWTKLVWRAHTSKGNVTISDVGWAERWQPTPGRELCITGSGQYAVIHRVEGAPPGPDASASTPLVYNTLTGAVPTIRDQDALYAPLYGWPVRLIIHQAAVLAPGWVTQYERVRRAVRDGCTSLWDYHRWVQDHPPFVNPTSDGTVPDRLPHPESLPPRTAFTVAGLPSWGDNSYILSPRRLKAASRVFPTISALMDNYDTIVNGGFGAELQGTFAPAGVQAALTHLITGA